MRQQVIGKGKFKCKGRGDAASRDCTDCQSMVPDLTETVDDMNTRRALAVMART